MFWVTSQARSQRGCMIFATHPDNFLTFVIYRIASNMRRVNKNGIGMIKLKKWYWHDKINKTYSILVGCSHSLKFLT